MKVVGVVEKLYQNAAGLWSVNVNKTFYGGGRQRPAIEEGQTVRFNAVQAKNPKYWNIDGMIDVIAADHPAVKEAVTSDTPTPTASKPTGSGWRPDPTRDMNESVKQGIISRQAAQNTAVAFLQLANSLGAIPIAKSAKAGDQFTALLALKDKLTSDFNNYSMGTAASEETQVEPADDEWSN